MALGERWGSLVQLRWLAHRVRRMNGPGGQRAPSLPLHLMLVGAELAISAFRHAPLDKRAPVTEINTS
ncbi:hypothetical protein ACFQPF_06385 [Fictibacillus iocasae]|uniref:Uncharacterized protein n=1 Tax=Fictibacillus iocasae TaxID=2715437 RepID=A0ABW2NRH2_9BACL